MLPVATPDISSSQLSGEKVLVTGAAGQIAFPLVEYLARNNDVWGIARFGEPGSREKVEAVGATTRVCDLETGRFDGIPSDFSYVVHLAAFMGPGLDFDHAISVNAEGTGLLLQHCQTAKAALLMSTHSVYRPATDPMHVFLETDPIGEVNSAMAPTYSMSKIAQEAVGRYCSRAFDLPVVIARMNASYGANGGLPTHHIDAIAAGSAVNTRWNPCMYSPIHQDDINEQVGRLLSAATVPATIVNWAGDEPVSVQEWCGYVGELLGVQPIVNVIDSLGTLRGSIASNAKRAAITGPCRVDWRSGLRRTVEARYPGRTRDA